MKLVKNEPKYYEFIRHLRNNEVVKKGFIEQEEISPQQHEKFMAKYGSLYYVCLLDSQPVGFVGQIENDIRVATHPDYQGRSVGSFMINELMKLHPMAVAKVKIKNEASLRLFEKCGFEKKYYILERSDAS